MRKAAQRTLADRGNTFSGEKPSPQNSHPASITQNGSRCERVTRLGATSTRSTRGRAVPADGADELKTLGEDIPKNGLTSPIVLWSDRKTPAVLVDGRSRLDALEKATASGQDRRDEHHDRQRLPRLRPVMSSPSVDPCTYVLSANLHRRHLAAAQKRELIAKLIKVQPEKSDRQIAETVKASPTTVGTVRAKMEATATCPSWTRGPIPKAVSSRRESLPTKRRRQSRRPKSRTKCCNSVLPLPSEFAAL